MFCTLQNTNHKYKQEKSDSPFRGCTVQRDVSRKNSFFPLLLVRLIFFSRSLTRWAAPYYLNPWNRLEVWRRYGCICCCHSVILGSIQSQPHVHHSHKINVNKSVTEVSFDKLSWPLVSFAAVLCVFMQCCNFGALHDNTKNGFTGDYR